MNFMAVIFGIKIQLLVSIVGMEIISHDSNYINFYFIYDANEADGNE